VAVRRLTDGRLYDQGANPHIHMTGASETGVESDAEAAAEREAERHVPVEVSVGAGDAEHPSVDENTRVDVQVEGRMYPTARMTDGRYVAWWFDHEAPDPDAPATTEWVAAPTRFLAAGTIHELWADPTAFDSLVDGDRP